MPQKRQKLSIVLWFLTAARPAPQYSSYPVVSFPGLAAIFHIHLCLLTALYPATNSLFACRPVSTILWSGSKLSVMRSPPTSIIPFPKTPSPLPPFALPKLQNSPLMLSAKKCRIPNVASPLVPVDTSFAFVLEVPGETQVAGDHVTWVVSGFSCKVFLIP